ncbi:TRAFAC clade GTPase domain-containing protein [Kitasatospora sp. NBC_00458]|uniref:TRAFAC clade GTPase domain-containing protein n=1 Tax=Kitasatospora sp. NBC_00458 TaxID=2903568 RepID=UPI002E16FC29
MNALSELMAVFFDLLVPLVRFLARLAVSLVLAPLVAAARALRLLDQLVRSYGRVLVDVLRRRDPQYQTLPLPRPQDEPQPAHRTYAFGPARRDLRLVAAHGPRTHRRLTADALRTVTDGLRADRDVLLALAGYTGVLAAVLAALPLVAAALLAHALLVLLLRAGGGLAVLVLTGLDQPAVTARRLRQGVLCPHCFERVRRPEYECSRAACRRRHSDLRPGRYGVLRRRCQCDERLPTTLLTGRYRLPGYCTHGHCGRLLSTETGRLAEHALPLVGGRAAGKTQLMAAMLAVLRRTDPDGRAHARFADEETAERYRLQREVLEIRGHPRSTPRTRHRAHSVLLDRARPPRLLHLFDTAGEHFVSREDADALRYARAARTFLFVLDPLAVPGFWDLLDAGQRARLDRTLASSVDPQTVFGQAATAIAAMGVPLHRSRLAVAISKTDLLDEVRLLDELPDAPAAGRGRRRVRGPRRGGRTPRGGAVPAGPGGARDSDRAAQWLRAELGLGNLVQAMHNEFGEVRFFFTAAVLTEDGSVHPSVAPLLDWCLADGRRARARARAAAAAVRPAGAPADAPTADAPGPDDPTAHDPAGAPADGAPTADDPNSDAPTGTASDPPAATGPGERPTERSSL